MYLTGILVISVYLLVLYIAVAGRLWCGCAGPQSVRTEIFLWLEKLTDGELSVRMRRAPGVWTAERIVRKAAKQVLWIAVALWTGFSLDGYFTPIRPLAAGVIHSDLSSWEHFWTFFYALATYGYAGFMPAPRIPFKEDAVRDRGSLAYLAESGKIENMFRKSVQALHGPHDCQCRWLHH